MCRMADFFPVGNTFGYPTATGWDLACSGVLEYVIEAMSVCLVSAKLLWQANGQRPVDKGSNVEGEPAA